MKASNAGGNSAYSNEANATTARGVPGLVGQWHFDEPRGDTTVVDSSFTGNHGTLVGGTQQIVGTNGAQAGNALDFDGMNDHVLLIQNLPGVLGGTATLATWIRTTQIGNNTFWQAPGITGVEQGGGGNDIFWGWIDGTGRIGMQAGNGAGAKSANPINDNNWHHVAFTRNATTGRRAGLCRWRAFRLGHFRTGLKTTPFPQLRPHRKHRRHARHISPASSTSCKFSIACSAKSEIQALRLANVVRQATTGDDTITINRSTTNGYIRIYLNQPLTGTPWYAIQPAVLGSMQIDGLAGNDMAEIAINGTAGFPIRRRRFVFNGGDGNDSLSIQGNTTSGTIPHTFRGGTGHKPLTITAGQISIDSTATGGVLNTTVATGAK